MHPFIPDTRNSLILRLTDCQDVQAWEQFVVIYEPLVYRLARSKGFQDSDALEIVQEVMVTVSRVVERWEPDPEKGRFRDWLFCIARNLMIKFMTRRKHQPLGSGDSGIVDLMDLHADSSPEAEVEFDLEYRRQIFRVAVAKVQTQVTESTWQVFWATSMESQSPQQVAKQRGMTLGAVYVARSRVRGRLREFVRQHSQGLEHVQFDSRGGEQ